MLKYNFVIICVLLGIDITHYCSEKKEKEKKELLKMIKEYFGGMHFLKMLAEVCTIFLSITLAIEFGDWHEELQQKNKLIELLQAAESEIEASLSFNNYFTELYENGEVKIVFLKNVDCTLNTLDKILENDDLIINMSSVSYSTFCNYIDLAIDSYETIKEADEDDEKILLEMKGLCNELEMLLFQIQNEIGYLNNDYTFEELQERTEEYKNKFKGIEVQPSDLFPELK